MPLRALACAITAIMILPGIAFAQKAYSPGASDSEIKLGQTMPYSGPVSAASGVGAISTVYFDILNKTGGINGRKVSVLSMDDGYSPPKSVEMTRKLVESDEVLMMYGSVGTPTNAATQKYLNIKKVPQLFISTGASRFKDAKTSPWTLGLLPTYELEGRALARYVVQAVKDPKVAVIYQNDDLGRDFTAGFRAGFGANAKSIIVSEQSFEIGDTTINSQVVNAKASGANVLYFAGTQKFGAMQIRTRYELGWNPVHLVCSTSGGVETVLKPAGLDASEGVITTAYAKDPTDPALENDPEVKEFTQFVNTNLPQRSIRDSGVITGYIASYMAAEVLRRAGDNLTRENIMKIAASLKDVRAPMLLPGVTFNTTPTDYSMITKFQVQKFSKGTWIALGSLVSAD